MRDELRKDGFVGFLSVRDLAATRCIDAPQMPGVYVLFRGAVGQPTFLDRSPGGWFKGKDPTMTLPRVRGRWVDGTDLLYVGMTTVSLRERLIAFLDFGSGRPVGHWGGRLVWQLAESEKHVLCWRSTSADRAGHLEHDLVAEFRSKFDRLPFANLVMPRGRK